MRDAEQIEAQISESDNGARSCVQQPSTNEPYPGSTQKIAPWRWKAGQSGNPNGKPKRDFASFIAQQAFERNPELIYKGLVQALARGSGFVFQVASDRAYGKLKERIELSGSVELSARLEQARKRRAERNAQLKGKPEDVK